jgi:hypothetical protein
MLLNRLSQQPLHPSQALLELCFLEHPELQVYQRGQSRRDPGVKLAGVDIGDQSGEGVSAKSS